MEINDVQAVVRGVSSADEDTLESLEAKLRLCGALDAAIVYYPEEEELGVRAQWDGPIHEAESKMGEVLVEYGPSVEIIGVERSDPKKLLRRASRHSATGGVIY